MKTVLFLLAMFAAPWSIWGQGTFAFNNRVPPDINARVSLSWDSRANGLTGDAYTWQLLGGPQGELLSNAQLLASGTFRTGLAAGYVNPPANAIVVPGVPAGARADVWFTVLWNGGPISYNTFGPFTVTLTVPPAPPNNLPMGTFPLVIAAFPEPSSSTLICLGSAALFVALRVRSSNTCLC